VSKGLLATGYLIAVPAVLRFNGMVRRRDLRMLATLELGTALILAGWVMERRARGAVPNAAALVGFPLWYWWRGRNE